MAQFLFKATVQSNTSVSSQFHFNNDEVLTDTSDYKNRIRIAKKQFLLDENFESGDDNPIATDLTTLFRVNDFLHIIAKSEVVGENKKRESSAFELGTKIVAVENPNNTQIDIILSKGVSSNIQADEEYFFVFQNFIDKTEKGVISLDAKKLQKIQTEVPLFDSVTFAKLFDDFGNELTTEVEIALIERIRAANALTTRVNNVKSVKIAEGFKSDSEVSLSLLGVPRAETQLSLFSDVSTLGFDDTTWEVFKSVERRNTAFEPWETRKTIDAQRFNSKIVENIDEQALELTAFPVPYTYPWDAVDRDGSFYKPDDFTKFKRWILLGNLLYLIHEGESYQSDFLDPAQVTIKDVSIAALDDDAVSVAPRLQFEDRDVAYRLIDIWTETFIKIDLGTYINITKGKIVDYLYSNDSPFAGEREAAEDALEAFTNIAGQYKPGNTTAGDFAIGLKEFYKPGYDWPENSEETIVLRTKETYRYQPGRISGFTFGTRSDVIASSGGTTVEWGVENETDAYVIQLTGGSLSIVRRSTIPLSDEFLDDNALTGRQVEISDKTDPFTEKPIRTFYELQIPRAQWNGDPLNGNGPSGYQLTPQQVTMWKIEFSWYGAVGAKFYAYIPVGNGEARWVLVHTIVIENKLFKACLEDAFFRMKYQLTLRNRENSSRRQFIYKYGSSVYIDGGDEGTKKQFSYNGDNKDAISNTYIPLIGLKAKETITNRDGVGRKNRKIIYPELLNVNTDNFTQIDIVECEACPGFGFTYDNGLKAKDPANTIGRKEIDFHITEISKDSELGGEPTQVQYLRISEDDLFSPVETRDGFTPFDDDAQILMPGFGRRFIDYDSTLEDFAALTVETEKEKFLFAEDDLKDADDLFETPSPLSGALNGSTLSIEFDISEANVLDKFDIPVGAPIQIEADINFATEPDENISVVLQDSSSPGVETSEPVNVVADSPTADGLYTFRLEATKEGTSKVVFKTSGTPTTTTIEITKARVAEFKISRVKEKTLNLSADNALDIAETPTIKTERFLRGDAKLKIASVSADGTITYDDGISLDKIETILAAEGLSDSPLDIETFQDNEPFDVADRRITIDRTYFDGVYSSPIDEPYKEYTWFVGNKAVLSPINKLYAVPNLTVLNENTEMRFLNPERRLGNTGLITGKPIGEFRIAFTNVNPSGGKTPREEDLLFIDYGKTRINALFGAESFDRESDTNDSYNSIETFQLDYRIKEIPNDTGTNNGGFCSLVKVSAAEREDYSDVHFYADRDASEFTDKYTNPSSGDTIETQFDNYPTNNILIVEDTLLEDVIFDSDTEERLISFKDGELGLNNAATGIFFTQEPLKFSYQDSEGIEQTAIAFALDGDPDISNSPDEAEFTLSFVKLEYTYNGTGAIFREKKKIFGFDPFPLYPIVFTRYGSQLNNINFKQGNVVNSPEWTLYDSDNIEIYNPLASGDPGYIDVDDASSINPENFQEENRLSGLLVDKASNKRLRKIFTPGESVFRKVYDNGGFARNVGNTTSSSRVRLISSFYAGGDDNLSIEKFKLDGVFKEDRNKIQQDFRDSKAIYIIGKQPEDSPAGSFRVSINTSEV